MSFDATDYSGVGLQFDNDVLCLIRRCGERSALHYVTRISHWTKLFRLTQMRKTHFYDHGKVLIKCSISTVDDVTMDVVSSADYCTW